MQLAEKMAIGAAIYGLGYLALIAAESGQLADAEHQIRRTTGVGTDLAGGEHFVNAIVSLAAATVLDVRGDRDAAADAARLAVGLAGKGGGILELAKALVVWRRSSRTLVITRPRRPAGMRPAPCFEVVRTPI